MAGQNVKKNRESECSEEQFFKDIRKDVETALHLYVFSYKY
jgi:hypothetical protein